MGRRIGFFALTLWAAISSGCDDAPGGPRARPAAPPTPGPAAGGTPIRAEDATGIWDQAQVEAYLKQDLKLTEVSLTGTGGGSYTGTGKGLDGKAYRLDVKQVPGGIACEYVAGETGRGRISFGNPVK